MRAVSILVTVSLFAAVVSASHADGSAVDGGALYAKKCAMCHGTNGVAKPTAKGSKDFNDPAFTMSTDEITKMTLEGKNKMPKFAGKLTPEEVAAISAHVKTLAPKK